MSILKSDKLGKLRSVYDKYKELDSLFALPSFVPPSYPVNPYHIVACDMWEAIKEAVEEKSDE